MARLYRLPDRYLSAAKRIKRHDPHLFELVRTGKTSVDEARRPWTIPDERRAVVRELFASGQARTLKQAKRLMHETIRQAGAVSLPEPTDGVRLERLDICEALDRIEPGSVDLLLTDPPYGEAHIDLYDALAKAAAVWLKDGGSCLVLTGHPSLPEVLERMRRHLRYDWVLAYAQPGPTARIWAKGILVRWKPVLWFTKGTPPQDRVVPDLVESPRREKAYHAWGQSEAGMAGLIQRFSDPGATVVDPFVGGGSTAAAAVRLHRRFIGFDIDEQALATTASRLRELERQAAVSQVRAATAGWRPGRRRKEVSPVPQSPTKSRFYRGEPYWERETPRQADAGRVRLKYYENHGKLQVVQLWPDADGNLQPGKTVTLDVEALALSDEARALLQTVLEDAR